MKTSHHLIEAQILMAIILIVAVVTALSTYISINIEKQTIIRDLTNNAKLVNEVIYRSLIVAMEDRNKTHAEQMVKSLATSENIEHIGIYDTTGKAWSRSERVGPEKKVATAEKIKKAIKGGKSFSHYVGKNDGDLFETLTPIRFQPECAKCHAYKKYLGVIEVGISTEAVNRRLASLYLWRLVTSLVSIVLLIVVLGGVLSYLVARPIEQLISTAGRLSQGDLAGRVDIRSRNEIGQLGQVFNQMANTLEKNINELEQAKMKMETAVKNIGEAMSAALDFEGLAKVILEQAVSQTDFAFGSLMMVDEANKLIIKGSRGLTDGEIAAYNKNPIRVDDDVLFQVVHSKTFVAATGLNPKTKLKHLAAKRKASTLYSFPLIAEGKFIGLINLVCLAPRVLKSDEIRDFFTLSLLRQQSPLLISDCMRR